jgi:hypothetical protein
MSEEMEQLEQRRRYLVIGEQDETTHPGRYPMRMLVDNAEHRREYTEMLDAAKAVYTFAKTPSFTAMIRSSAQWVDAHVPVHDTGEIAENAWGPSFAKAADSAGLTISLAGAVAQVNAWLELIEHA